MLIASHLSDKLGSRYLQSRARKLRGGTRMSQSQVSALLPPHQIPLGTATSWESTACAAVGFGRDISSLLVAIPELPLGGELITCRAQQCHADLLITCRAQQWQAQLCSPAWKCRGAHLAAPELLWEMKKSVTDLSELHTLWRCFFGVCKLEWVTRDISNRFAHSWKERQNLSEFPKKRDVPCFGVIP